MKKNQGSILCWLIIMILSSLNITGQVVRILPMGNSITYDETTLDVPPNVRPPGQRISYRYRLYQLLKAAGDSFDYVGSENAGNDYFQNPEMDDNAGFPGINAAQWAYLIQTGYDQRYQRYEAPGSYLLYYPADIILMHVGTCDLEASPDHVKEILDEIRVYLPNAWILVARIIQRVPYSALTTTFNDNVQAMVAARGDARIVSVNMETGAGINYSTEMVDMYHPNQNGYQKMAAKWFAAIDKLNTRPVISTIPKQSTIQGTVFVNLGLDGYVSDAEDPANIIKWTYRLHQNSKLSASIDGSRILHVSVADHNWYGSDTLTLKATDSGNGAFQKTDSVKIVYTVIKKNSPPVITSAPPESVNEDNNYNYTIVAEDSDGNQLTYLVPVIPGWLSFSAATHTLSGRPTNSTVGVYDITLCVTDGIDSTFQNYQLTVNNVNDIPIITSTPVTSIKVGQLYYYELTAADIDIGDVLTFSAPAKPNWLTFTAEADKGILYGTPTETNMGSNSIILKVSDGHSDVLQGFTLGVTFASALNDRKPETGNTIYPNPASNVVYLRSPKPSSIKLMIYDITGVLKIEKNIDYADMLEVDITKLTEGIYLYKAFVNGNIITGKLTKIK